MIGKKVPGIGPAPCDLMFIGEGPGRIEAATGLPFVGDSGKELDGLLRRCLGLSRRDVRISNIVKWRTDEEDSDPTKDDIERDKPDLYAELNIVKPKIIIPVGKVSAQVFLGPATQMEKVHGIPHYPTDPVAKKLGAIVIPTYHPAAAMRLPDRYGYPIEWAFERIGEYYNDPSSIRPPKDAYPSTVYQYGHDMDFDSIGPVSVVAIDTEGWIDKPWGLSFSYEFGRSYILRHGDSSTSRLNKWLHDWNPQIILHHDLHDRPILKLMGVDISDLDVHDTMIQAWHLNNVHTRSLKINSYRLNGVEMGTYSSLTHEAEIRIVSEYLTKAWEIKKCLECVGSGKGPTRRVIDADCQSCLGSGRIQGARAGSTKWCSCAKTSDKCGYCVDGAHWPMPPQTIDLGTGKKRRPWSISRRLKTLIAHGPAQAVEGPTFVGVPLDVSVEDSSVEGNEGVAEGVDEDLDTGESAQRAAWRNILPEIKAPIIAELGPMPRTTLDDVRNQEAVIKYVGADPDGTLRNYFSMKPQLSSMGVDKAYDVDRAILPMLDRMSSTGIMIDRGYMEGLHKKFQEEITIIQAKLSDHIGYSINPGSPDQVADLLFNKLDIKAPKFSKKTGKPSTDEKTLELLKIKYAFDDRIGPIVDMVRDYRECVKMDSTYVLSTLELADRGDRLHCEFLYTNTPTGRLAARNINTLALPINSDRGKKVAKGFVAKPGCVLVSVDMDQIEMRVGAHLSQDSNLMSIFIDGQNCTIKRQKGECRCHDPHWSTAAKMYNKPVDQITKIPERYTAKTCNFGIFYGMTETRLINEFALNNIKISRSEATDFLELWFAAYPDVRPFLHKCHAEARTKGYVETILGKRRYLPGVHSQIDRIKEEALRQAGNTPVQGSAADIFKSSLVKVEKEALPEIRRYGYCEPLLPIHDAVVLEVEESIAPYAQHLIEWQMSHAMKLTVPLGASGAIAKNLGELK